MLHYFLHMHLPTIVNKNKETKAKRTIIFLYALFNSLNENLMKVCNYCSLLMYWNSYRTCGSAVRCICTLCFTVQMINVCE